MDALRSHRFLVAVDDSEATSRTVDYVGRLLEGSTNFELVLMHLLPPLPQALLEHGGGHSASEEESIEEAQEREKATWLSQAGAAAEPVLESVRAGLVGHGVSVSAIRTHAVETIPEDQTADMILREARTLGCGTIVVGRRSLPWLRELFHRHVAEDLAKHGEGFSVLIVE